MWKKISEFMTHNSITNHCAAVIRLEPVVVVNAANRCARLSKFINWAPHINNLMTTFRNEFMINLCAYYWQLTTADDWWLPPAFLSRFFRSTLRLGRQFFRQLSVMLDFVQQCNALLSPIFLFRLLLSVTGSASSSNSNTFESQYDKKAQLDVVVSSSSFMIDIDVT